MSKRLGDKRKSQKAMQTFQCKKQTSTNKESVEGKAPPLDVNQICRRKVGRVAGGMRICCRNRDRRQAGICRGIAMQHRITSCRAVLDYLWLVMLSCGFHISRCMDHVPPLEGKWCHDSAYECHRKSPQKMAKQSDKQPGQQPRSAQFFIS